MKERAGRENFYSKGKIFNQCSTTFKRILVLVCLFMSTSAQTRECSVFRLSNGDRIEFYNYTGTCNNEENPCKQMNSNLISTSNICICQCKRSHSTYREDLHTCIRNQESRNGRCIY